LKIKVVTLLLGAKERHQFRQFCDSSYGASTDVQERDWKEENRHQSGQSRRTFRAGSRLVRASVSCRDNSSL